MEKPFRFRTKGGLNEHVERHKSVTGPDWPEHLFRVDEVYEDLVTGYSITGPLKNEYGEPDFDLILRVHSRAAN